MVEEQRATSEEGPAESEARAPARAPAGAWGQGAAAAERPRRRGFFPHRRRRCFFCVEHVQLIDYKNVEMLRRFLSDRGRIEPRRKLGTCAKHQRALSTALKRARHLALLPYTQEHMRKTGFTSSRSYS